MSADEIQLDESWVQDYNDAMQALNYNEGLIQQRQEEQKMPYEQKDNSLNLFVNKFKKDICLLSESLVKGTLTLYSEIADNLRPTPTKSHYTFNLRDTAKVF